MPLESSIRRIVSLSLCALVAALPASAADPAPAPETPPAVTPPATKPQPGGRPLSTERWIDRTYGVSLLPPTGAITENQINDPDGYVMRLADDQDQFRMALAIKRSNSKLTLAKVVTTAKEQIVGVQGTTQLLDERAMTLGGRPCHALYFQMPQAKGINQFFAQGIVQIDAQTFALLEIRCDIPQIDSVRATFDAVMNSIQLTDLKELDKQREATLALGAKWRNGGGAGDGLTLKKLHAAIIPQQYFRLVGKTGEAGYMRMNQSKATRNDKSSPPKPGVLVEVESRIVVGTTHFDTLAEYFLADDDSLELWTVTTTQRPAATGNALTRRLERDRPPAKDAPRDPNVRTSRESGIRAGTELAINVEGPDGPTAHRIYHVPRAGYLSQVEALMLPQLLPIDRPGTYGFYCYLSRRGAITLRTDTITPALTGVSIETRVSPNEPSLRLTLDANRKLLEKQLSTGIRQVPTSIEELNKLWPGR